MPAPVIWRWLAIAAVLISGLSGTALAAPTECGEGGTTSIARIRGLDGPPVAEGEAVTVEATVTASFPGDRGLNGFYLQSHQPVAGIFVYAPDLDARNAPRPGERWRIAAHTGRYREQIQLERLEARRLCGGGKARPAVLDPDRPEAYPGLRDRLVTIRGPLHVAEVYNLGRYGTLALARGGRPFHPNNGVQGGRRIDLLLDDGSYRRDPRPVPHTDAAGVRRAGDRIGPITGILAHAFGRWRIHPVKDPVFVAANPRPSAPAEHEGLRVLQLNLRNYFIDRDGRGPPTEVGFVRQRERLRQVIRRLDADLLVLHEIQNQPAAVEDLLTFLNAGQPPAKRYRQTLDARREAVIRSVLLYRPQQLVLVDSGRQMADVHPRDPVTGRFRTAAGERLRVVAAHFKSRGGCPDAGDIDQGAGCWAERRLRQSRRLIDWLDEMQPSEGGAAAPILVLADFNAYAQEAAITAWLDAGFVDLLAEALPPGERYTYNYRGLAGYLDHALATPSLMSRIDGVHVWHINADEPAYLDDEAAGIWRSSDHDPMVIDLDWSAP
ncbi:ExeM/NucH family extracellular endonuclease [Spiribacter onubensis]|uniref:ExeM/NucH family extracellular endonuclease n=1 Tax=Spiribacter onubensis TaxID=3122420 RepID=A0ABV3S6G4_9GAMM